MGMALVGHTMHFSYSDMLEMETDEFREFVKIAQELSEQ